MTTTVSNKVNEVENRFNALTSKQQQDAEVIDARDGETSLKARLDRDIEKAKEIYVPVEGSHISTDSSVGYAKDVEILGNTIQNASNLADIRSVGDKVEGQELYEIPVLSRGKNLFDGVIIDKALDADTGNLFDSADWFTTNYIMVNSDKITFSTNTSASEINNLNFTIVMYDINYKLIGNVGFYNNNSGTWTLVPNTRYIRVRLQRANYSNIQIEEGTVATPYEPYVEDKLTILSPTPLEKVGDVADRIIEKDEVLGVEKNIDNEVFTIDDVSTVTFLDNVARYVFRPRTGLVLNRNAISNYTNNFYIDFAHDSESWYETGGTVVVKRNKTTVGDTEEKAKEYLKNNPIVFLNPTTQPQFIPLPHDQQVKLRTFAGKTNISFLTEIEGTIKAQVPKSLGATVNTHNEQINNLNKELDRVKKLEESTVSTVTTESDFTTVEATTRGYFEDVKLDGKTLVNLVKGGNVEKNIGVSGGTLSKYKYLTPLKNNTLYTIILNVDAPNEDLTKLNVSLNGGNLGHINKCINGVNCITLTTNGTPHNEIWIYFTVGSTIVGTPKVSNVIVLEGDHTQNPPSGYIEGLKSVGQSTTTSEEDVDEIVVSSVNENLFDKTQLNNRGTYITSLGEVRTDGDLERRATNFIRVKPNTTYTFYGIANSGVTNSGSNTYIREYDINKNVETGHVPSVTSDVITMRTGGNTYYIRTTIRTPDIDRCVLKVGDVVTEYTPHQSDKKRLLYYNEETQTWEKPILREWDSIEKHANGKYYYHVRSKEGDYVEGDESLNDCITDLTVSVKKLAEEKVYECTNIDLITYANETNYIVECGAISPKTTLKVHNNISNVVSLLQKKVSLLESDVTSYMITQNRLMLASRYNADNVTFKVDYPSMMSEREVEIDYDLFKLIQDNIIVGPENYDVDKMLEIMDLYAMIGFITWEMWDYLYEVIDSQINPVIGDLEGAPEI